MGAAPGADLAKLIATFNASQDKVAVTGLLNGVCKGLVTSVAAAWRAGQAPHIAPVFEVGTQQALDKRGGAGQQGAARLSEIGAHLTEFPGNDHATMRHSAARGSAGRAACSCRHRPVVERRTRRAG